MATSEFKVKVKLDVDFRTAFECLKVVEMFLNGGNGYELIRKKDPDGLVILSLIPEGKKYDKL